ncbi:TOM1-like protein 2 isoform X1 [Bactrocera neohumeralis]|uniref:TOM1-like protein 2 isoform X1 n=1 Tax=Bactrocera neohumeralis TaxID=98809 RepID=UPI0021655625|nr:TOM1-like protein 2 isoform X1 [Bactrocera neohumeralis]
MASFFNNPFSTPIGQRIEQATDSSLASENWALNMEICDMINESSDTARDAMKAIRKRLSQNAGKDNQVIMYTLTVLETCVKNCGKAFHVLVAQKDFIQELIKLIGPKNDPPAVMQEKVLSLIQIWADAFKNQPDLNGVTQMYMELKNKGIEFPQTDIEHLAPIYTPQRSVPEPPPQVVQQTISPQHAIPMAPHNNGPTVLSAEQTTKLQSELEVVAHNMSVLGEMLTELKPGQEDPDDYALLTELTATCKEMQARIVDLIGRINDDELTAELLRLNDELNNLFLRHQRYEKNRTSSSATSPSAILGAAIGVPPPTTSASQASAIPNDSRLIDLDARAEKLSNTFSAMSTNPAKPLNKDIDEFDMLAQSRTDTNNKNDLLKDIPTVDAAAGSVNLPFKRTKETAVVSKPARENEVDEMEAWLGSSKEGAEGFEETLTSTEFDKFLEERAAAAENLPNIAAANTNSSVTSNAGADNQKKSSTKKPGDDDLLLL